MSESGTEGSLRPRYYYNKGEEKRSRRDMALHTSSVTLSYRHSASQQPKVFLNHIGGNQK